MLRTETMFTPLGRVGNKEEDDEEPTVDLQVGFREQQTSQLRQILHFRRPVSSDGPYLCNLHKEYGKESLKANKSSRETRISISVNE